MIKRRLLPGLPSVSDYESKVWGKTRCWFNTPAFALHELKIVKYGYCSIHYHRQRANRFVVVGGRLKIVEFYGHNIRSIILGQGKSHIVPSLVPHMFIGLSNTTIYEEYFPDRGGSNDVRDIVRLTAGGVSSAKEIAYLPGSLYG